MSTVWVVLQYLVVCGCMYDHSTTMYYMTETTKTKSQKHKIGQ